MKRKVSFVFIFISALICENIFANSTNETLNVWVAEAIIAAYSYDYQNLIPVQQQIAHYFTASGWRNYSQGLLKAGILDAVKTNSYTVNAVPLLPPTIHAIAANQWQASMPILVVYKNQTYSQKQTLNINLSFETAPANLGVRGFNITALNASSIENPCVCEVS